MLNLHCIQFSSGISTSTQRTSTRTQETQPQITTGSPVELPRSSIPYDNCNTFTENNYDGSGSGDHGHFKGDSDDEDYDYNELREGSADERKDDIYDSVDGDTITTGNVSTLSPEQLEQIR